MTPSNVMIIIAQYGMANHLAYHDPSYNQKYQLLIFQVWREFIDSTCEYFLIICFMMAHNHAMECPPVFLEEFIILHKNWFGISRIEMVLNKSLKVGISFNSEKNMFHAFSFGVNNLRFIILISQFMWAGFIIFFLPTSCGWGL